MPFSASLAEDSELENDFCSDLRCGSEQCTSCPVAFLHFGALKAVRSRCEVLRALWRAVVPIRRDRVGLPIGINGWILVIKTLVECMENYYNLLVYHASIRHCSIIKYYNYHKYILNSILSFKAIMIYIYSNILIYSINYIEFDCQFKIYSYICSVSFRDTIMA